jgi:CheY-like chemotaxis protein/anti-sigma regulatory factor (Ser/Thr protein kinase)
MGRLVSFISGISKAAADARKLVCRIRLIHQPDVYETFMPVDVAAVARSSMLATDSYWNGELGAKGVHILFATNLETPILVLGDETQLREALMNLILNAADAMPRGGIITLSATVEASDAVLSIADTGTGMTEEVKAHCSEAFYTTKGAHGSGLGLAMVAGIVGRHKGRMEIDSAPGRGTTIRLRLPAMAAGEPTASHVSGKATADITPGLRILVAEDDAAGRDLLEEYLKISGHTVESAQDGSEAMEKLSAGTFDLVITDRSMPGACGDEVARAAKARNPGIPVILLTGFGDLMHDAGECPSGVDLVLSKPVTLEDMQRAIRKVMAAMFSKRREQTSQETETH